MPECRSRCGGDPDLKKEARDSLQHGSGVQRNSQSEHGALLPLQTHMDGGTSFPVPDSTCDKVKVAHFLPQFSPPLYLTQLHKKDFRGYRGRQEMSTRVCVRTGKEEEEP